MQDIQDLARRIALEFRPRRIVLFGSYAGGQPTEDSDVDLLVLAEHQEKSWEYATRIRDRLCPAFPLDLLVRTPAQLRQRLEWGDPFLCEIADRGKVLYDAERE